MDKDKYLQIVRKQIHFVFDRDAIEAELNEHFYESIQDLLDDGFSLKEAEEQAVKQMGDPIEVGKLLNKEHQPILGYLWMLSRVMLGLLLILVLLYAGGGVYGVIMNLTPATIEKSVETIVLDLDLDMPTHKVKIDHICVDEQGNYSLTYRMWKKCNYSRAWGSDELFEIIDNTGENLFDGSRGINTLLCSWGAKQFILPEDHILLLICSDGKIVEIDLEEYCDETE